MSVIGVSRRELKAAIAEDVVAPHIHGGRIVFNSEDVKVLILNRWTPGMLAKLLPPSAVPALNVIERVTIELPAHQRRFLELLAAKESAPDRRITGSDIVQRALDELISSMALREWQEADAAIPGFAQAVDWPLNSR